MTGRTDFQLAVAAFCACLASDAFAADMPVKAPPATVVSGYDWSGLYVGGHLGYGYGMKAWRGTEFTYEAKGFLGGGQVGFNFQVANWVFGIETDVSWTNVRGIQTNVRSAPALNRIDTDTAHTKIDRFATVAGRLGLAQGRSLVYVKAGVAWAKESHDLNDVIVITAPGAPPATQTFTAALNDERFGLVIGFGSEFALWDNWSFRGEYNLLHFYSERVPSVATLTLTNGLVQTQNFTPTIQQDFHLVKFGLNYRFWGDGRPVLPASAPAPGYNWTGWYVGAQAGYGFGREQQFAEWFDLRGGGLAGITTGTNVQAGVFVLGIESEWLWTGINDTRSLPTGAPDLTSDVSTKVNWLSLTSLRAGFVAADRWLIYVKGGVALARETHGFNIVQTGVGGFTIVGSGPVWHTGYLAGIGIEHAFLGNWSAKLEYNYLSFAQQAFSVQGLETQNTPPFDPTGLSLISAVRQNLHLVKVGLNYHFNPLDVISVRY